MVAAIRTEGLAKSFGATVALRPPAPATAVACPSPSHSLVRHPERGTPRPGWVLAWKGLAWSR